MLAGLDHYFAGQYDHAINVWTRALFFDRSHARARAYIERARRAQAERQRESEELLHNGTVAYRSGNVIEARRLLQAALDAGAPLELAFPMLERLNQIEPMPALTSPSRVHRVAPAMAPQGRPPAAGWRISPFAAAASLMAVAGVVLAVLVVTHADVRGLLSFSGFRAEHIAHACRARSRAVDSHSWRDGADARSAPGCRRRTARRAVGVDLVRTPIRSGTDADQLVPEIQLAIAAYRNAHEVFKMRLSRV